jgi:outer membrane protein OmpA-like peptidoglycan-associated protein
VTPARGLAAAAPLALLLVSGSATPPPDPLDDGAPTSGQIADAVRDIDLRVTDVDLDDAVTDLETERTDGAATVVSLSSDILFAFGSAELTPAARAAVEELGREVADAAGEVRVTGHTDAVGTDTDNQVLSQARAQAVADVLVAAIGDGAPGVVAEGRGESEPVASNGSPGADDPAGRALNRRVEVRFGG